MKNILFFILFPCLLFGQTITIKDGETIYQPPLQRIKWTDEDAEKALKELSGISGYLDFTKLPKSLRYEYKYKRYQNKYTDKIMSAGWQPIYELKAPWIEIVIKDGRPDSLIFHPGSPPQDTLNYKDNFTEFTVTEYALDQGALLSLLIQSIQKISLKVDTLKIKIKLEKNDLCNYYNFIMVA